MPIPYSTTLQSNNNLNQFNMVDNSNNIDSISSTNTINNTINNENENKVLNKKRKYGAPQLPVQDQPLLSKQEPTLRRHSQACDRCRLKKIKCDGLKPNCSQCNKVNFICKTSDVLTRRGFPRGYTEMLEKQVVQLQNQLSQFEGTPINENTINQNNKLIENQAIYKNDQNNTIDAKIPWDKISNTHNKQILLENSWLTQQNLTLIINALQLNYSNMIPQFLLNKHDNNTDITTNLLDLSIFKYFKFKNSLLSIFKQPIKRSSTNSNDPIELLIICFIIQFHWNCFDNLKLYHLTKIITSCYTNDSRVLQLYCISIQYLMSIGNEFNDIIKELFQYANIYTITNKNGYDLQTYQVLQFLNYLFTNTQGGNNLIIKSLDNNSNIANDQDSNIPFTKLFKIVKDPSFNNLLEFKQFLLLENYYYHLPTDYKTEYYLQEFDIIKIQLTLYYLLFSLLNSNNNIHEKNKISIHILSLYQILLFETDSPNDQPLQLKLSNFLPLLNNDIITYCVNTIQQNNISNTCTQLLTHFIPYWFNDEPNNSISLSLNLPTLSNNNTNRFNKQDYLQTVEKFNYQFNHTPSFVSIGRSNLLKTNSNAIMDQFNMFTNNMNNNSTTNINNIPSLIFNQFANKSNIIDMSKYQSQILLTQDDTDDGYVEDDDEDDDDEKKHNKPLEIPFRSKRYDSLFNTKLNKPPSHRKSTVDHIILEDKPIQNNTGGNSSNNTNHTNNPSSNYAIIEKQSAEAGNNIIDTPRAFTDLLLLNGSPNNIQQHTNNNLSIT